MMKVRFFRDARYVFASSRTLGSGGRGVPLLAAVAATAAGGSVLLVMMSSMAPSSDGVQDGCTAGIRPCHQNHHYTMAEPIPTHQQHQRDEERRTMKRIATPPVARSASRRSSTMRRVATPVRISVDGRSDDTTTTAATTASNSTEFQLQAALEYKEEMQKVRLAKLLQELTSLALEKKRGKGVTIQSFNTEYELEQHSKLQRGRHAVSSLQRMQTSEVDWATPETPSRIELIDLSSVDLTNLSREEAWYIIDKLHSGAGRLTVRSFLQSVRACAAILRQEPTVVDLTHADVVTVVGDIHGCLPSLRSILAIIQEDTLQEKGSEQTQPRRRRRLWGSNRPSSPLPRCIVFAGDIVDRGDDSLEVLITLLLLKLVYPNQIYLLRGNHEDTMVADVYGFSHELQTKYNLHHRLKQKVWEVMGDLFAALPMGAVTSTAFIVHGGLPSPNFTVRELRNVSVRDRCRYPTVVHPTSKVDTLLEGLLWSDPVVEPGIHPSKRGPGIQFGPDVAQAFLQRERLRYLVRAHEPVENGVKEIVCSDDTSVITVFSSANYPNGEGWNYGAVLNLFSSDGTFEATQFAYDDNGGSGGGSSTVDNHDPTTGSMLKPILDWAHQAEESILSMIGGPTSTTAFEDKLRSYVKSHQLDLAKAFAAKEHKDDGRITANDWATIMEEVLDLHDVSWIDMQPNVAPANDRGMVDWREYLIENSTDIVAALSDKERMGRTVDHEDKILAIFEFLDVDRSGVVKEPAFRAGVNILNRLHLPKNRQIKDPHALFARFDDDGDGVIGLHDFREHLSHSHLFSSMTSPVNREQMGILARNRDMIQVVFEFLDSNGDGTIQYDEWKVGIELLNKQLRPNEKLYDARELFRAVDTNGSGSIDLNEFSKFLGSL